MTALADLNAPDRADFTARFANVYEHAPWVAEAAWNARPFADAAALLAAMQEVVRAAPEPARRALIDGHPDLAGKAARAGALTAESSGEQQSAGLDRLSKEEFAEFHRLNAAHRDKFGFPFIICVRRHTRESILARFAARLGNSVEAERAAALDEVHRIAALRLDALLGDGSLKLAGRLSTHVLDNHAGRPAAGLAFELRELARSGRARIVATGVTNGDGRTDAPLIAGRPVPIGRYELAFAVAAYYAARGVPLADPPFLDEVALRFAVAEPEGHYHVPLLMTPWSYATYRGS